MQEERVHTMEIGEVRETSMEAGTTIWISYRF